MHVRLALLCCLLPFSGLAQDTRDVREPIIPAVCASLPANLTSANIDENRLDTSRIQHALDTCAKGQAVQLKPQNASGAFLTGPLHLRQGVTLLIDRGVTLFASRDPRIYDIVPGSCGIVAQDGSPGCQPLIDGDNVSDAAVMGEGSIDARGGSKLIGKDVSWWDLAEQARKNGNQHCFRILVLSHCNNFTLYKITLKNSPNFHVYYADGDGFTAWGVIINTPKSARNTDGIDPAGATNVTITHCFIHTGDDHVAIKAGNQGHVSHVTISHNHFYTGHGMSIGSETYAGADSIRVTDLTIDEADNGLRIKSNSTRGGLVENIAYQDVCIRNTKNPIFMDEDYEHVGKAGTRLPFLRDIELHDVAILGGGKLTLDGFDENHRLGMLLDKVSFNTNADSQIVSHFADIKVTGVNVGRAPSACTERFVPMP